MGNYLALLSPVDIQMPAPNFQKEFLGENSNQMKTKENRRGRYIDETKKAHSSVVVTTTPGADLG